MRYRFIFDFAVQYPITVMCQTLDVTRSGYYFWRRKPESLRAQEDRRLLELIKSEHQLSFSIYGAPRIHKELELKGEGCGRRRVARIMRVNGIFGKHRRKFFVTTDSHHSMPVAENVLNRQFEPEAINQTWLSDITYIPTFEGWVFLAAVMDAKSRRIVGWAMSSKIDRMLACNALRDAVRRRKPAAGLLHHSDRGSQYASNDYQDIIHQNGMIPSMSRKGNCWDNAPMESFFHSMKGEWLNDQNFRTRDQARAAIFDFIEVWYNRRRLHSALGYQAPETFERRIAV
jgi:transposase InsO family protein